MALLAEIVALRIALPATTVAFPAAAFALCAAAFALFLAAAVALSDAGAVSFPVEVSAAELLAVST